HAGLACSLRHPWRPGPPAHATGPSAICQIDRTQEQPPDDGPSRIRTAWLSVSPVCEGFLDRPNRPNPPAAGLAGRIPALALTPLPALVRVTGRPAPAGAREVHA